MAHGANPIFPQDISWEAAQLELEALGMGDGLPMVPPTEPRLAEMLAGIERPDEIRTQLPPLFGGLSWSSLAYQSVLAGCWPGDLAAVMTASEACVEPQFNLLGLMTTTGTAAVAVLVHGPARQTLGLNAGTNCLGPGNRGNATIGRAVSLALRNIGGAREMVGDMATMGQPGKYSFCFAEDDSDLLPPLPQRRGFGTKTNSVTVLGVSGTAEILPDGDGDKPELLLRPLARAMQAAMAVSGHRRPPQEQFFLLPPELAQLIRRHDWDLNQVQHFIFEAGTDAEAIAFSAADIHPVVTGGPGIKMTYLPLWAGGTASVTREMVSV